MAAETQNTYSYVQTIVFVSLLVFMAWVYFLPAPKAHVTTTSSICGEALQFPMGQEDCVKMQEHLKRGWLLQMKEGYVELTPPDKNALGLLRIYGNDAVKK